MTKWHVIVKKLNILEVKSMHIPEGGNLGTVSPQCQGQPNSRGTIYVRWGLF